MLADVSPILTPNETSMREHLDFLFGGFLHGFHDGRIELAWTDPEPDASGRYRLRHGETYETDADSIDRLIARAVEVNSLPRTNVYIGAALRRPGAPANKRCEDADFYCATAAWCDLDDKDANDHASKRFAEARPSKVVLTGEYPHWRHQLWWRFDEPVADPDRMRGMVNGLSAVLGGDSTVSNPSRVMRLAGTIAWDQKKDRRPELTRLFTLKNPGLPAYMPEHIERAFPPLYSLAHAREKRGAPGPNAGVVREKGAFGLDTGKVVDGRERHMSAVIAARLIDYCGQFGAVPTPDELFDHAWDVYERTTDLDTRPGRGKGEFAEKCRATMRRFELGKIRGVETLEAAVATYEKRRSAKRENVRHEAERGEPEPEPSAGSGEDAGIKATAFAWVDPSTIPPRAWIYGRHYIRKFVSTTVAPGGVGKTALGVVEALAIASGKPLLGIKPDEQANVWVWNGEDPLEELQRRIMAAALHYGLSPDDVVGKLFVDTGRTNPIVIAERTKDGAVICTPVIEQVIATIRANRIGVFTVDPFVACHRVTENDNSEIERVAKAWAHIADATNCAVELVHHVRKTNGNEVGVEDGRGATALLAAARSARALNRMMPDEGARAGIEEPGTYFRTDNGKANLAPPSAAAHWYHLASVDLYNDTPQTDEAPARPSDKVGVVEAWEWPNAMDNVTVDHMHAVRKRVGQGLWREDQQARDWVGHAIIEVLNLPPGEPSSIAKAKALQAIWLKERALETYEEKDPETRKKKTFVRPGPFSD